MPPTLEIKFKNFRHELHPNATPEQVLKVLKNIYLSRDLDRNWTPDFVLLAALLGITADESSTFYPIVFGATTLPPLEHEITLENNELHLRIGTDEYIPARIISS